MIHPCNKIVVITRHLLDHIEQGDCGNLHGQVSHVIVLIQLPGQQSPDPARRGPRTDLLNLLVASGSEDDSFPTSECPALTHYLYSWLNH